jgi:hypothetical protein
MLRPRSLPAALAALALLVPLVAGAQPAPAPVPRPEAAPRPGAPPEGTLKTPAPPSERTFTFQLVLLAASVDGPARFENVPANAQKALADVKDFLPYKSYQLLDLAWLRSSRSAEAQLAGPDGRTLSAQIRFYSPQDEPQRIEVQRLVVVEANVLPTLLIEPPRTDGAPTATAPRPLRPLLETSFGMRSGETVVVGTSKLDGPSKALVVLLSALP